MTAYESAKVSRERAVVLQVRRYGDADAVVTLFSETRGKVGLYLRSARGPKRKETLQPFYELELELRRRVGSDLYTARALNVSHARLGLSARLPTLAAASCVVEAYRDLFHDGDADPEAFALLLRTLTALEQAAPLAVLAQFTPALLAHIGYERAQHNIATLADFRGVVRVLEEIAGRKLDAHRFFLRLEDP